MSNPITAYTTLVKDLVGGAFDKVFPSRNQEVAREVTQKIFIVALPILCGFAASLAPVSTILGGCAAGVFTALNQESLTKGSRYAKVAAAVTTAALAYFLPLLFTASAISGFAFIDFKYSVQKDQTTEDPLFEQFKGYIGSKVEDARNFMESLVPAKTDTAR